MRKVVYGMRMCRKVELVKTEIKKLQNEWSRAKTYRERENIGYIMLGMKQALRILESETE